MKTSKQPNNQGAPPSPLRLRPGFVCPPRAVTVRVPVPEAGVVDIPIVEKEAQGQQRHHKVGGRAPLEGRVFCSSSEVTSRFLWLQMTLSPSYRMDDGKMVRVRSSRNAQLALTQYRALSSSPSAALLELQPVTGAGAAAPQRVAEPQGPSGLHPGPRAGPRPSSEPPVSRGR